MNILLFAIIFQKYFNKNMDKKWHTKLLFAIIFQEHFNKNMDMNLLEFEQHYDTQN